MAYRYKTERIIASDYPDFTKQLDEHGSKGWLLSSIAERNETLVTPHEFALNGKPYTVVIYTCILALKY